MTPPRISVLTPVYDTDEHVLRACVDSVRQQTYGEWELCLVDDGSTRPHVVRTLRELQAADPRVLVRERSSNGGIVAASNDAAALATGDVLVLLDHDDVLYPDALRLVAAAFEDDRVDYAYTDEDVLEPSGIRADPFLKPDWSPERFRTQMFTCHLSAVRRQLFEQVGGFRDGFDGSQDWDLVLRVTEQARRIVHIPQVLYHWRRVPTSVLAGDDVKPYAYDAAARALAEHATRVGLDATVEELACRGHFRLRRRLRKRPLVSIVVPTRGASGRPWGVPRVMVVEAVRGVLERSSYESIEVLVVADEATSNSTRDQLAALDPGGNRLRVIEWSGPFNFSAKCNLGASLARGELLLFLNDDTDVITEDWIETMAGFLEEPDVGAVGALLLFEDGRIQHAGHVHLDGVPGHLMFGQDPASTRNRNALRLDREVAGVTAACLMTRAATFSEVGGFSLDFPNNYNDVDLCLKLRQAGYRIVVSPHAKLHHFESVSRDPSVSPEELEALQRRWLPVMRRDPYYNPAHVRGLDSFATPLDYP